MSMPILATKLYVPPPRPKVVPRLRLVERLDEGLSAGRKLALISAPAGFGKTTLVSEWISALTPGPSPRGRGEIGRRPPVSPLPLEEGRWVRAGSEPIWPIRPHPNPLAKGEVTAGSGASARQWTQVL